MSHLPGKFVWFEHVSNDVPKARAFYSSLFGWKTEGMPMQGQTYYMIQNGADGIGGFRTAPPGVPSHWIAYLSVADVDASAKAAVAAGGKLVMPPTDFAGVGRGAAIVDPTGAAFSIWRGAQGDRPDAMPTPVGDWHWTEHMSKSAAQALTFYEKVFGFGHEDMKMENGVYRVLTIKGTPRAGIFQNDEPNMPAFWMSYVAVADCDATARRAGELGATVQMPPTDIPEVGRFAAIMDPFGAAIGFVRPV